MNKDELVKIHITLPNHDEIGGESFWAEEAGNQLYKIENIPFYAYGLNFKDTVRATPDSDETLEIQNVFERSGNKTMRLCFESVVDKKNQTKYIENLEKLHCTMERRDNVNIAVNIKPEGDFQTVYNQLEKWANEGILDFETAEVRIEGSFDDVSD